MDLFGFHGIALHRVNTKNYPAGVLMQHFSQPKNIISAVFGISFDFTLFSEIL